MTKLAIKPKKRKPKIEKKKTPPGQRNPKGKGGFAKGFSGNPLGRPKLPPEIKAVRDAVKEDLIKSVGWISKLTTEEAKRIDKNKLTLLESGVLKCFRDFSKYGYSDYPHGIMDQTIGKAVETLDIDTNGGSIVYNISPDFMPKLKLDNNAPDNKLK